MIEPITDLARVAEREPDTQPRGRRAARLRLAKAYVLHHLAESGLNADKVGRHLAISGRSVQMLFEAEGTTFSAYVLEQRLLEALRRLLDPRLDTQAISQISYAAGFVDLSHFNRSFRMRFGDTPSGVRNNAA
jgi:AraC-like DNA-binding protein